MYCIYNTSTAHIRKMSTENLKSKTSEKPLVFGVRTYTKYVDQREVFKNLLETYLLVLSPIRSPSQIVRAGGRTGLAGQGRTGQASRVLYIQYTYVHSIHITLTYVFHLTRHFLFNAQDNTFSPFLYLCSNPTFCSLLLTILVTIH